MTEYPKYLTVQATRSFDEFTQGASYRIDSGDERMLTLLGAGYFHEDHNPALQTAASADSSLLLAGNDPTMAEQEHVNVEAGWKPANDVQVPEKMTGSKRATTADEEQVNGQVGTESGGDSTGGDKSGTKSRRAGGTRNN